VTSLSEYRSSRELFYNLTLRELRSKYKRSVLGWAWSMVNPLANMVVYTLVFKYFLKIRTPVGHPSGLHIYSLYLLCGLLPWNFFQGSVTGSVGSIVGNGALIKKSYFPRPLLPAATVAATLVSHLIEMSLLLVVLVGFGNWRALVFTPVTLVIIFITAVFGLGLGLAMSALNVYFRDVQHFMGLLFLVWMYMTPIIYPINVIPHRYQEILKLNPMTDMALSFRAVLYDGTWPSALELGYFALWAIGLLVVGVLVFNRLESRFAEEL
jgi:ABC-type polysaccharide/polyol phosphate export permease